MKFYTSYFGKLGALRQMSIVPICIARGVPKFYGGAVEQSDEFSKAMANFGRTKNIKSIGATIQYLTELAKKEVDQWEESQNTTQTTI